MNKPAVEGRNHMTKKLISYGLVVVVVAQGCASWEEKHTKGTVIGGLAGAGLGALIGAATGSWAWGAVIGLGAGALAGYAIADSSGSDDPKAGDRATYATEDARRRREEADREFRIAMEARDAASSEFHLKKSIELYPTPGAYNNLGLLQLQAGDREAARSSFRQAIALDPQYDPALQNLEKLGA
jgi:tetratricopeptide (TPR) repeat protein